MTNRLYSSMGITTGTLFGGLVTLALSFGNLGCHKETNKYSNGQVTYTGPGAVHQAVVCQFPRRVNPDGTFGDFYFDPGRGHLDLGAGYIPAPHRGVDQVDPRAVLIAVDLSNPDPTTWNCRLVQQPRDASGLRIR